MNRRRVTIGSLVLRHSGLAPAEGAALGRMVETQIQKLMMEGGTPLTARSADVVRVNAPPVRAGASRIETARMIANGVYRGLLGKI